MVGLSSCFGARRNQDDDHTPLLPQYDDDTSRQRRLHKKLHTYQMVRALGRGYMPSNDQLIINLRALLASDLLNPDHVQVSDSGRLLTKYSKQWLTQFIDLLKDKNSQDQLQDFIWLLTKSQLSVDLKDLKHKASRIQSTAKTMAAYESVKTIGSLLLTNSDFRLFLADLQVVGREIFSDSAQAVANVAQDASKTIAPADGAVQTTDGGDAPTQEQLTQDVGEVTKAVASGVAEVGKETRDSAQDHFTGAERDVLVARLKQAVTKLRYRKDYTDSVSVLSLLIQRLGMAYSRAAEEAVGAVQEDTYANDEMADAVRNIWSFAKSFGSEDEWNELERLLKEAEQHRAHNPSFERFIDQFALSVQRVLTDPSAIANLDDTIAELKKALQSTESSESLRQDMIALIDQLAKTFKSVAADEHLNKLFTTSLRLWHVASPQNNVVNKDILADLVQAFLPLFISMIQHVPIPRLEVSTPEVDLLLENLILEPGKTVNHSSFLPFRLRVETQNDVEIRRTHNRALKSTAASLVTIKIDGLSIAAEDLGYVAHVHTSPFPFNFTAQGLSSFHLDERGIDIHLDLEISRTSVENMLTLKDVRVRIHHFDYELRKSKLSWIAWLVKPLLRAILRKTLEKQLSTAITDFFHAANREIVFARERLRATRVADPQDWMTFFKAVSARLQMEDDPEVDVQVGVGAGGGGIGGGGNAGHGVFKGVYAPGSMVKVWEEEGRQATERVEDWERGGWRNDIFDIVSVPG